MLTFALAGEVRAVDRKAGVLGFECSADLVSQHGEVIGRLAWGGPHTGGRFFVSLTGDGCAQVVAWVEIVALLEQVNARITRLDLAADFPGGEVSVDDALAAFREGAFAAGGKPPSGRLVDDLGSGAGRTLYVGSRQSSKLCRVYEKGRQLGQKTSPWVRVEVEFKNRCYEIPYHALLAPLDFLAGSYPILREWLGSVGVPLHAIRRTASAVVEKAVHVGRQHVGGLVAYLRRTLGWPASRVVNHLEGREPARRLRHTKWQAEFLPQSQAVTEACVMRWQPESFA
jgi:phage replication initiation protein